MTEDRYTVLLSALILLGLLLYIEYWAIKGILTYFGHRDLALPIFILLNLVTIPRVKYDERWE